MDGITAKALDALSMFWAALDENERRMLVLGLAYLAAALCWAPIERRRKANERRALAAEVAQLMSEARNG